jgi:hypothetical protein
LRAVRDRVLERELPTTAESAQKTGELGWEKGRDLARLQVAQHHGDDALRGSGDGESAGGRWPER